MPLSILNKLPLSKPAVSWQAVEHHLIVVIQWAGRLDSTFNTIGIAYQQAPLLTDLSLKDFTPTIDYASAMTGVVANVTCGKATPAL